MYTQGLVPCEETDGDLVVNSWLRQKTRGAVTRKPGRDVLVKPESSGRFSASDDGERCANVVNTARCVVRRQVWCTNADWGHRMVPKATQVTEADSGTAQERRVTQVYR